MRPRTILARRNIFNLKKTTFNIYFRLNNVVPRCFEISDGAAARERVRGQTQQRRRHPEGSRQLPRQVVAVVRGVHWETKRNIGNPIFIFCTYIGKFSTIRMQYFR